MTKKLFIPSDSVALARGADKLADMAVQIARTRGLELEVVRTGSRGLYWLEPLIEVECGMERIGYGPVTPLDLEELFDAGFLGGKHHALHLGPVEEIPFLARQTRICTKRCGHIDPLSFDDFLSFGGGKGLEAAKSMDANQIVQQVVDSGLLGRGGAAFPTGIKWKTTLEANSDQKYIVCNADEGDSGSFADRLLMESDPYCLLEGMAIAGLAVGADRGYIYLRSEYPKAYAILKAAVQQAKTWLGNFTIEIRRAAGSYVCGEETALLESIEGKRGIVRAKPPVPAVSGLFGMPTVVNNVLTLASVPYILSSKAESYSCLGQGRSRGTLPFQLSGHLRHAGIVEVPFGMSLRELLYDFGGGSKSGRPLRAVQVGGPLGAYIPQDQFDICLDYDAFAAVGAVLGHGSIVAMDDSVDMSMMARHAMAFCAHESCGKCTPCRIGSTRGVEVIDDILSGNKKKIVLLKSLCDTMANASQCAMGGMTPLPVLSAVKWFARDFGLE